MLTHQLQGAFEGAYEKAAASSKPEDWMNAALLGKQFSNAYREESRYPAAYQYLFTSPIGGGDVWRSESSYWNGQRPKASRALFSVPVSRATQAAANLEGLAKALLAPREIERDGDGWLDHPALPVCDENVRFDELLSAFGLETYFRAMDGDVRPEEYDRYYDEQGGCAGWTPTPPKGDGWRLLVIYDTEDGPYAMFAREKQTEPRKCRNPVTNEPAESSGLTKDEKAIVNATLSGLRKRLNPEAPRQAEPMADESALFEAAITKLSEQTTFEKLYEDTELDSFWALWKEARAAQSGQRAGVAADAARFVFMIEGALADIRGDELTPQQQAMREALMHPELQTLDDVRARIDTARAAAPTQQQEGV